MGVVVSRDGTPIAYERRGSGPPVILVGGGLDDGSENAPIAAALANRFTTYNYARRGRGNSGDTQPYDVEREIEDIDALIAEAGGRAHLFGVSSGGMFALEAAAAGLAAGRIAVYDVPYDTASDAAQRFGRYREELYAALAAGRRGDAVVLFMRVAGSSDEEISGARTSPYWPGLEAVAHTLAYDAALYGPPPTERLVTIAQPVLVATGEATEAHRVGEPSDHFFASAADAVAASIPNASRVTLPGQGHVVDPDVMAPVLGRFFSVDD
jgi:pimeloyl-ACP methyl ester carboxylesterase